MRVTSGHTSCSMPRNLFFLSTPLHPSPPVSTAPHPSPLLPIPQPTNFEELLQQQPTNFEELLQQQVAQLGAPTNFEELLQQQVAQLGAAQPCPEDHHILVAFRQTIRSARQGGEGGGYDDDEDDEVMMTTNLIVKNTNCPITMRHVEELDDPVCCLDCRHVYEKSAILEIISQNNNCPVSGFVLDDEGEVVLAAPAPAEWRTLTTHDPITNRSLDCVIRRAFSNSLGVPFFLLHPLDTPIMFFRISGRTGELQEVDDEEAERIMPAAAYALAKKSLHLTPSGLSLQSVCPFSQSVPSVSLSFNSPSPLEEAICFTEDDVINLDTELGFGIGGSLAEGVDITTFLSDPKTSEILVAEDPEAEEEMKATLEQTARQAPLRSHDPPAALSSCPIHPFTPLASSQEAEEETEATLEQTARQAAFCSRELSHGLSCPLTLLPFPLLSMYVLPRRPKRRWRQPLEQTAEGRQPHIIFLLFPPLLLFSAAHFFQSPGGRGGDGGNTGADSKAATPEEPAAAAAGTCQLKERADSFLQFS
ncbi:unnamed protein product [Closterium sp. NIES-64]|nr:unnamed protein product [Closterium sp. NIES-64]